MKNIIVTLFILLFTNSVVLADCVTGYACSVEPVINQRQENEKQEVSQNEKDKKENKSNSLKKDGFFVDGKENNKPQYTEMFTLKGIIP